MTDLAVYWLETSGIQGRLRRWSSNQVAPQLLTDGIVSGQALAIDGNDIYVLDNGSGKVPPGVRHFNLGVGKLSTLAPLANANGQESRYRRDLGLLHHERTLGSSPAKRWTSGDPRGRRVFAGTQPGEERDLFHGTRNNDFSRPGSQARSLNAPRNRDRQRAELSPRRDSRRSLRLLDQSWRTGNWRGRWSGRSVSARSVLQRRRCVDVILHWFSATG